MCRLEPVVDKSQPKIIDPKHPVVRGLAFTPEGPRVPDVRIGTSRAALCQSLTRPLATLGPQASTGVRRSQLTSVPLLPSKFSK